jgi:hypothetical protein
MSTRLNRRVIAKAASYTVNPALDSPGTVFTNAGAAGAVTFTLPAPGQGTRGWWYRFLCVVDQNLIVAAPTAGTLIALHDAAANSVALQTGNQKIAGVIEAQCLETVPGTFRWAAYGIAVGHTYTTAT